MTRRAPNTAPLLGLLLAALASAFIAPPAFAQSAEDRELEAYLAERELDLVLAAHLRRKLVTTTGPEQLAFAERLGVLYVKMLGAAKTPDERRAIEQHSRDMLRAVPAAETLELRLNLAKASYLRGEEIAERDRLRLVGAEEQGEALRILRSAAVGFDEIAARAHQRVEQLERRENVVRGAEAEELRAQLTDARRLRSLGKYYAGWSKYYVASLGGGVAGINEALNDFGWILNAQPGQPASVERAPKSLMRYPHVARAAIGAALCASLRGNDTQALRWLETIETSEEVPKEIIAQLFDCRVIILAAAKRWADVDLQVRRRRVNEVGHPAPLPPLQARLLAVLTLEAAATASTRLVEITQRLAQTALADLIASGETGHVIDLVKRYGTEPIGDKGFIVHYARGLRSYDACRASHQAKGAPDDPTTDNQLITEYRDAAALLDRAADDAEALRFAAERAAAIMKSGLARYYAGDFLEASERFSSAFELNAEEPARRQALWFAVVALDRAVDGGRLSVVPERDRLALVYLQRYPGTEEAARLLLRRAAGGALADERAVEILLAVDRESPLYDSCRREAARLLYQIYRKATGENRDFAAARFAQIAEEVLKADRLAALTNQGEARAEAAERVILRARQIADAALGSSRPDPDRAERALALLEDVLSRSGVATTNVVEEIAFRRLQIDLARNNWEQAQREFDGMRGSGNPFLPAAERLMYRKALSDHRAEPDDPDKARLVVAYGTRVIDRLSGPAPLDSDPGAASLFNSVAAAAATLFSVANETAMRDLALRLDHALIDAGRQTAASLRRFATLSESAGDGIAALDAWRLLMAALEPGSDAWFEARFETFRLLAAIDPADARAALDQHKILHPRFGPAPWGERIRALDEELSPRRTDPKPGGGP